MDRRDCLFIIKKSVRRGPTFQEIQSTKDRSLTESNVIQQIHQLIIEQQLSQNNITLHFAAIKLQAMTDKLCQWFVIYIQYVLYPCFCCLIRTDRTHAIIYRQLINLFITTVFAGSVSFVIIKIELVEQLRLFASATFLVYRGLFSNVVGSNIYRL